jgi:ABC-type antimicrobial peptide transport system permease subunit
MLFGIVGDIRGQAYLPLTHPAMSARAPTALFVRVEGRTPGVAEALRRELQALSPNMPFVNVSSFETLVAPQLQGWRLGATMFAIFGGLALVIAAVGLYSVLAYAVSQRIPEIGVRMALGATRPKIVALFMRDGLGVSIAGVLIGIALALFAGSSVEALLYETSPRDPMVFGAVVIALLLVAALASFAPALRAARVDPSVALRNE